MYRSLTLITLGAFLASCSSAPKKDKIDLKVIKFSLISEKTGSVEYSQKIKFNNCSPINVSDINFKKYLLREGGKASSGNIKDTFDYGFDLTLKLCEKSKKTSLKVNFKKVDSKIISKENTQIPTIKTIYIDYDGVIKGKSWVGKKGGYNLKLELIK